MKYKHVEAYCLMQYRCEDCRYEETIWNSRDGVTPFTVTCDKCGGIMQHVNWGRDCRKVNHKPGLGDRVFVDVTEDNIKEVAEEYTNKAIRFGRFKALNKEEILDIFIKNLRLGDPTLKTIKHMEGEE